MDFTSVLTHLTFADACGILGGLFFVATLWMQTMVPLRVAHIVSNGFFLGYGVFQPSYPALVLYVVLLPVNCVRLYQMVGLVKQVRGAAEGDLSMDWLKPFMTKRRYRKGDTLFHKGERGEEMFYTLSGRYRVTEIDITIEPGQLVGELAFLTPDHCRTQTVECIDEGQVLTISYDKVMELYFQNPIFGFYFLRLASERLLQNISRLEAALSARSGKGNETVQQT
ncbi:MAG: Crp/Fnr family transcriptional regulator [Xanthobacteraceae bacterium]